MVTEFFSNARRTTSLAAASFGSAVNLRRVDISTLKLQVLPPRTFQDCRSLESVGELPRGIFRLLPWIFHGCSSLKGRIDFPDVTLLSGTSPMFKGCLRLEEIHFAASAKELIMATGLYQEDPTLGAENATVHFDL